MLTETLNNQASAFSITDIDFPRDRSTLLFDINNASSIVGEFTDTNGKSHGLLNNGTTFTQINFPGADFTRPVKITDSGMILVQASKPKHNSLYDGTTFPLEAGGH
ncbi:MAG: hypothetical protein GTN53_46105 [Candidatus Aminicenantes bacterium]|nr:hypothetical protein [Candidatus Aminicenantes bacterium]NIT29886.1 hypothetical protein [Candidatus Aminicenantes bacterium]